MEKMSLNSKLEVALEILSSKIADASKKGLTTEEIMEYTDLTKEEIEKL